MKRTIISLALITSSALLLGGCTLFPSPNTTAPQTEKEVVNEAKQFTDAIKSGKPTYCKMTKGSDTMEYWVKGKLFKMNSTTTTTDDKIKKTVTTNSHTISDATYMYSWGDQMKQGFKMRIPTEEELQKMTEDAKKYQDAAPKFEDETGYDKLKSDGYTINCKNTDLTEADFVPPTEVSFVDPAEMMKAVAPKIDGSGIDMQKLQELQKQYGGE
jgi:hypothetical protein